jgi:putative transposase
MAPILNGPTHRFQIHKGGAVLPRKPRLDTRNGVYHVMAKGNNGCLLFRQLEDFSKFMHLLHDSREKDPHILLSYCLMPNHIHLLIETTDTSLSKIMHRLLLRYSLYFNKRYVRSGHLFQNRFKTKPCKQGNYLLQLLVYIHDNPRKAGLVDEHTTYYYSSERIYQRKVATSAPVNTLKALAMIGPSPKTAWKTYHYHLSYTRNNKDEFQNPDGIQFNTEPSFYPDQEVYVDINPVLERIKPEQSEGIFDFLTNVPLDQICTAVADTTGVKKAEIGGKGRAESTSKARGVFIYIARKAGWRSADLTKEFGFHPGTIAYHTNRQKDILETKAGRRLVTKLRQLFNKEWQQ